MLSQGLPPGASLYAEPPVDFEGTAVVTSTSADIVVHTETIHFAQGSASSYPGIPDTKTAEQLMKYFVWKLGAADRYLLTELVMMNASPDTADGQAAFKGDADPGWETVDFPNIPSSHGVSIAPPVAATWQVGQGFVNLLPQQASIARTGNNALSVSYSTITTPFPEPLLSAWYIPFVNNNSEIDLFHDDSVATDFMITWKAVGGGEFTDTLTLGPYARTTITPSLPADSEGSAIIENLTASPTGLAIEVKDKSEIGDYSAYVPANSGSALLLVPWFTYQYQIQSKVLASPLLYQIISIIAAGKE
jgi:hypothetical protein